MQYEKQMFKNGQVLTADCLNRMEDGIKTACDAAPPACDSTDCSKVLSHGKNGCEWVPMPKAVASADWLAKEGEDGYILNSPLREVSGLVEIFAPTDLPLCGELFCAAADIFSQFTPGETYRVVYNGNEKECVAVLNTGDGVDTNIELGDRDPFTINILEEGPDNLLVLYPDATELNLAIYGTEKTMKIDPEYLPDGVPFTEKGDYAAILAEGEAALGNIDTEGDSWLLPTSLELSVGETYTVVWGGTEYAVIGQDLSAMVDGAVGLGDLSAFGMAGNGEPFMIMWSYAAYEAQGFSGVATATDYSAVPSLAIYGYPTINHQLDPKFLPEHTHENVFWVEGNLLYRDFDATLDEISEAFKQKKTVWVTDGNTYAPCIYCSEEMAIFERYYTADGTIYRERIALLADGTVKGGGATGL